MLSNEPWPRESLSFLALLERTSERARARAGRPERRFVTCCIAKENGIPLESGPFRCVVGVSYYGVFGPTTVLRYAYCAYYPITAAEAPSEFQADFPNDIRRCENSVLIEVRRRNGGEMGRKVEEMFRRISTTTTYGRWINRRNA